jgi:hypothetical protein
LNWSATRGESNLGRICRTAQRPSIALIKQAIEGCYGRVLKPVVIARLKAEAIMRVYPELESVLLPGLARLSAASAKETAQASGQD